MSKGKGGTKYMKRFRTVELEAGKNTGRPALRFAHLSDLHGCFYGENQEGLLEAVHLEAPDLIVVTGDMIVGSPTVNRRTFAFFKELTKDYPVFFCNGNHETRYQASEEFQPVYKHFAYGLWKKGVEILNNRSVVFEKNGRKVLLSGYEADLSYFSRFNRKVPSEEELKAKLGEKRIGMETVLLAHNPMFFPVYKKWGADLTFSGHLHGGYIRIPGIGGVISPQFQLFPKYDRGIFEEEGHWLCVSAGLGDHTISPRFFNPPELPVVTWYG